MRWVSARSVRLHVESAAHLHVHRAAAADLAYSFRTRPTVP